MRTGMDRFKLQPTGVMARLASVVTLMGGVLLGVVLGGEVQVAQAAEAGSVTRSAQKWQAYDGHDAPEVTSYMHVPFMPVSHEASADALVIAADENAAGIYYSESDAKVVRIAAEALRDDVQRVTGVLPEVSTSQPSQSQVILVGTVGLSPLIDGLVEAGKIDVRAIEGKWEAYAATVVDQPMPGVDRALVIAGSDRRGTAFGVFALSEAIGVSPWYWWGNVAVPQQDALYISGSHTQTSPGVKYRGIFLNDEDWGLQPWAARTFEPEVGNIGPKTYATIFELLLRLHANCIWPAMHEFPVHTTPFYLVPGNAETADDYAIVISTSHHEPMLRNSHEYDEKVLGPYDYWTNRQTIYDFWEQRVKETAEYESIYTIGLRGRADTGMRAPRGSTMRDKAAKIQNAIIPDQRQMIKDHVHEDPSAVPQIFIPYKETLLQYQAGLQLPDDITIVWPDDNHGYIRQLSTEAERKRVGGSGVYYHLSYWGVPRSYLWFSTTPPGMTQIEMLKAWDFEAHNIWLVNVGDLKPMEIATEFFLRMARDPEAFRDFDQHAYFVQWAERTYGAEYASDIADVLTEYFRLNIKKRPEHIRKHPLTFSLVANGDEAQQRLDDFAALVDAADAIYEKLPQEQKASYYELILYGVRASDLVNRRDLLAERSRMWAGQKRAATSELALQARAANRALFKELAYYNEGNADGMWNHMMGPDIHQRSWVRETQSPYLMPDVGEYAPRASAQLGVAVEGSSVVLTADDLGELPVFNPAADQRYFIDVFNQGKAQMKWSTQVSEPWIVLSQSKGSSDARVWVSIDWDKAPQGSLIPGVIQVRGAGSQYVIHVEIENPAGLDLAQLPVAVEHGGQVVIEAEDYVAKQDNANQVGWRRFVQATASDDGMTIQPFRAESLDAAKFTSARRASAGSPSLSYEFYTFSSGPVKILTQCLPTHRITSDHPGLRYAISVNGDKPQIIDINAIEYSPAWNANTMRAASIGTSHHQIDQPGLQTVQIWMVDAGVVLDKLTAVISAGTYETQALKVHATNTEVVVFDDPPASGGQGLHIKADSKDDYATLEIPGVQAGAYQLGLRVKKWDSRGIVQVAVADRATGPYRNVGKPIDLYQSDSAYVSLDPLPVRFATDGAKYIRFTLTGKNASSKNYWVLLDTLKLKPVRQR